jgi:hypothetical protein
MWMPFPVRCSSNHARASLVASYTAAHEPSSLCSGGRRAKNRGTGSRAVPHRLNSEERTLFDIARRKGFVELSGSGWRPERSDSPLRNTYRSWCDALGVAAIYVHKQGRNNELDEILVDLSPLRRPDMFEVASAALLEREPAGEVEVFPGALDDTEESSNWGEVAAAQYSSQPIYTLPMYSVVWKRSRPEAKKLAKSLAETLATCTGANLPGGAKGRTKRLGAPSRKPGKSRRHGGYGIEG